MNAWLIHDADDLRTLLGKVMPGATWQEWQPTHLKVKRKADGKKQQTASLILEYLKGLPASVAEVSSRKVKGALNGAGVSKDTWTEAGKEVECASGGAWQLVGRSFARVCLFEAVLS
jgi:hypothetical protein